MTEQAPSGHRILLLERVIAHCRQYPGLRFATMTDVAEEYRQQATSQPGQPAGQPATRPGGR